jgi:hypothetical protein
MSPLQIGGTMKGFRAAHGSSSGNNMEFVAERSLQCFACLNK